MTDVTVLRPATPATDGYSHRDVVLDADGVWWQRAPLPDQWLGFGERYETHAVQLPRPLTLVAKAREVTSLAGALLALCDQNDQLLAFARWLVSLDDPDRLDDRRTVTLDQIVDRARAVLAATDPLRGGE